MRTGKDFRRRATALCLGAGLLAGTLGTGALCAAPANDRFRDAIPLDGESGRFYTTTRGATKEAGEPAHAGVSGGSSVWWIWTAPRGGRATFYTLWSRFDTVLAVYTGDAIGNLRLVASNDDSGEFLESLVEFEALSGVTYRIAADGFNGEQGDLVLTWHVGFSGGRPPPNNLFQDRVRLEGEAGFVVGTNRDAFRELGEPGHAGFDAGRSIWYEYVSPRDAYLALWTHGSSYDTTLAVYTGDAVGSLDEIVSNDDGGPRFTSYAAFLARAGVPYHIAVDGYDGAAGIAVLHWRLGPPCLPPAAPADPFPPDGATGADTSVVLRWDGEAPPVQAVIYGADDRRDYYEVSDPALLAAADLTAVVIPRSSLVDTGDGAYALPPDTFGELEGLCPEEPFREQPAAGICSAFLAAPDLIASAGHCFEDVFDCRELAIVFGYRMAAPDSPPLTVPSEDVYFCSEIVATRFDPVGADWAVVRLDRPVAGRQALPVRRRGVLRAGDPLVTIGYPSGLPVKIDAGGKVRDVSGEGFFTAVADTYVGSSGSAVLDAATLEVEGILVRGEEDFEDRGGCFVSRRCPEDGCSGEEVTRSREFEGFVPGPGRTESYVLRFGPCGKLAEVADLETPEALMEGLEPGTTYCWQLVALGACGSAEGPVWRFTTAGGPTAFKRGDATGEGDLDLTDAVRILAHLFLGGEAPPCMDAADTDDSGALVLSDAVYLLNHLFLGGDAPPAPYPACGTDPTDDPLDCIAYAGCP